MDDFTPNVTSAEERCKGRALMCLLTTYNAGKGVGERTSCSVVPSALVTTRRERERERERERDHLCRGPIHDIQTSIH